ncbi:WhiB family transcriptional regulator [Streptomyces sp. LUP30]|uniref:WhiB family transcriptional regulator n=1 Tax=Streptomyces sp. LUP30 TaxID=1890285 RepID=UPI0008515C1C|nr:WhiB family transcriptional regulator [Streptomyces sp. LUP30]
MNGVPNALVWADQAACRGQQLDDFFAEAKLRMEQAKRVCASCPVRSQCLAEAFRAEDPSARFGVYGGLTAAERRELAKRQRSSAPKAATAAPKKPRQPATCGTRPGYQKHLREGTEICGPCRQANTGADNRLRRTGTTKAAR